MPSQRTNGSSNTAGAATASSSLADVGVALVEQAVDFLEDVVSDDGQMTQASRFTPGATLGKHLRHVSDHYRILLDALERSSEGATTLVKGTQQGSAALSVNYDARDRDVACETSRAAALTAFRALAARLRRAKERDIRPDWPVELDAVTPIPVRVPSSWSRELWFCSLHAVHHYSSVRIIATAELGLDVPPSFGVAPSTLLHQQQQA